MFGTIARTTALAATAAIALSMTACSGMEKTDDAGTAKEPAPAATTGAPANASAQFGPACAGIPKDPTNPGSFEGMAKDAVATAASHNPALATLVTAVTAAGLGDTLNNAKGITVFAPTNEAFAKIPQADLNKILADKATLTKVLTHHVVGQTITPEQLGAGGPFKSLAGDTVQASGSGEDFTVGGSAKVVCGNVKTANATVYLIDTVLMPAA
jgi:uncharacterized surface protein with fasciclin (FAS1) repeats